METSTLTEKTDPKSLRRIGLWKGLTQGDLSGGVTTMAECLKLSFAENTVFNPHDIFESYFQKWTEHPYDAGPTVHRVFELVQGGINHIRAVEMVDNEAGGMTAGCNPTHRASVLAMMPFLPTNALADLARAEARLTHLHSDAGEASAAVVLLCRHLINGMDWQEAIGQTAKEVKGKSKFSLLFPDSSPLNKGGYAPEVLRAAVSIVQSNSDFGSALDAAFKFSYPGHFCPILVGAIAGARWGDLKTLSSI
jgi:ADP-ribosylglycohydrolase